MAISGYIVLIPMALVVALFISALVMASNHQQSIATSLAIACVVVFGLIIGMMTRMAVSLPHVTGQTQSILTKYCRIEIREAGFTSVKDALLSMDKAYKPTANVRGERPILFDFVKQCESLLVYDGKMSRLTVNEGRLYSETVTDDIEFDKPVLIKSVLGTFAIGVTSDISLNNDAQRQLK